MPLKTQKHSELTKSRNEHLESYLKLEYRNDKQRNRDQMSLDKKKTILMKGGKHSKFTKLIYFKFE